MYIVFVTSIGFNDNIRHLCSVCQLYVYVVVFITVLMTIYHTVNRTILILHSWMASLKSIELLWCWRHNGCLFVYFWVLPSFCLCYSSWCYIWCLCMPTGMSFLTTWRTFHFWSLSRHHLSVRITHIFMLWIYKSKAHWLTSLWIAHLRLTVWYVVYVHCIINGNPALSLE